MTLPSTRKRSQYAAALLLVAAAACSKSEAVMGRERNETPATAGAHAEPLGGCMDRLRERLIDRLRGRLTERESPPPDRAELERRYRARRGGGPPAYEIAGLVLGLPAPHEGVPLLKEMLLDSNPLVALMAAVALALQGDPRGLALLEAPRERPLTNSEVESFLSKGALLVLDPPIPAHALERASVFREDEALFAECLAAR